MNKSAPLLDHWFRHEYGRLVASLARRAGVQHIEAIEDAAQSALLVALETWPRAGLPEEPSRWLFRVAHNELMEQLRTGARRRRILDSHGEESEPFQSETDPYLVSEVPDDLLQMLFACCDDGLPRESQLVLSLKVLCGFDIREIALRLFVSQDNAYKRLSRARKSLAGSGWERHPDEQTIRRRLGTVHQVLYLMFTEGYLSQSPDEAIRRELCEEALRLAKLLAEHEMGRSPESDALVALMTLHTARLSGRLDARGELLLLEEQDRSTWDRQLMGEGLRFLERSARGEVFSRYHAEAAIAAEHCLAPGVEETNWEKIVGLYELLEARAPSPLYRLNRALCVAQWKGATSGLDVLSGFAPPTWLEGSYLWSTVLADLNQRAGHDSVAREHREVALRLAPSEATRTALRRRWRVSRF